MGFGGQKTYNMADISNLIIGQIKNIPISEAEAIILKNVIRQSINYRIENNISTHNGEDIILLTNTLKTLNDKFKY